MRRKRRQATDLVRIAILTDAGRRTLFRTPRSDVDEAMKTTTAAHPSLWVEAIACDPAADGGDLVARNEPTMILQEHRQEGLL